MTAPNEPALDRRTLRAIPPGIWALGVVSMLMDISSEMIHALLPVYLVTVLATSASTVGLIEGIAEASPYQTRVPARRLRRAALPSPVIDRRQRRGQVIAVA